MSAISLQGNAGGTGTLTVAAPSTNTNRTLTLPDGTGTFTVAGVNSNIVAGTAVASTSGTSIDFTGIPTWVKRVTVMFNGVSTNGTSIPIIQLGTGSTPTFTTSGYVGSASGITTAVASTNYSTGALISNNHTATIVFSGAIKITNLSSNIWVFEGINGRSDAAATSVTAGLISLAALITAVRITTVNGTDTFDAGSINILYE